jgi:hypothetical protein
MSRQTFPVFVDQPGCTIHNFAIDGSSVGATAGTAGLDGRGQFLCTISIASGNIYTINWVPTFGDVPYVFFQPDVGQNATLVEIVSSTASQLVIQTVNTSTLAAVNAADLQVVVFSYNTTSYVS